MRNSALSIVVTVLLLLVLSIGFEIAYNNFFWSLPASTPYFHHLKQVKKVARFGPGFDILILGDSTASNGIDPRELQRQTGMTSYNFGTYSSVVPIADVYLLQQYLRYHAKPTLIIDVRSIAGWGQEMDYGYIRETFSDVRILYPLILRSHFSWNRRISLFAAGIVPSVANSVSVKRSMRDFSSFVRYTAAFQRPMVPELDSTMGFDNLMQRLTPDELNQVQLDMKERLHDPLALDPSEENLQYLSMLCEIADAHDIPVLVLSSYYLILEENNPDFVDMIHRVDESVASTVSKTASCTWYGPQPIDAQFVVDSVHTNASGAVVMTDFVSSLIRSKIKK